MTLGKKQCSSCGFSFDKNFIKVHDNEIYCDICYLDLLMNQRLKNIYLPSYFLSKNHQENFMLLFDEFSNKEYDWYSIIVAYVQSVPDIFKCNLLHQLKFKESQELFQSVPLVWQFDYLVIEIKESSIEGHQLPSSITYKIRKDKDGYPVQNIAVQKMSKDCQIILKLGFYLQFDFFTREDIEELLINEYSLLSQPYKNMAEEMIRYTEIMSEHLLS